MEELIYGGKFFVSKSIGLALKLEVNLSFLLCFSLYLGAIFQVQAPGGRGGLYLEGQCNGWLFALPVWGAYFQNFTVYEMNHILNW